MTTQLIFQFNEWARKRVNMSVNVGRAFEWVRRKTNGNGLDRTNWNEIPGKLKNTQTFMEWIKFQLDKTHLTRAATIKKKSVLAPIFVFAQQIINRARKKHGQNGERERENCNHWELSWLILGVWDVFAHILMLIVFNIACHFHSAYKAIMCYHFYLLLVFSPMSQV